MSSQNRKERRAKERRERKKNPTAAAISTAQEPPEQRSFLVHWTFFVLQQSGYGDSVQERFFSRSRHPGAFYPNPVNDNGDVPMPRN